MGVHQLRAPVYALRIRPARGRYGVPLHHLHGYEAESCGHAFRGELRALLGGRLALRPHFHGRLHTGQPHPFVGIPSPAPTLGERALHGGAAVRGRRRGRAGPNGHLRDEGVRQLLPAGRGCHRHAVGSRQARQLWTAGVLRILRGVRRSLSRGRHHQRAEDGQPGRLPVAGERPEMPRLLE